MRQVRPALLKRGPPVLRNAGTCADAASFLDITGRGGWFMDIMDKLDPKEYVELANCGSPMQEHVGGLRDMLEQMHQKSYVHGDVRDMNVMVSKTDTGSVTLINFDWAGRIGEVKYPPNVYRGQRLWWPESVEDGKFIMAHEDSDIAMVNHIEQFWLKGVGLSS